MDEETRSRNEFFSCLELLRLSRTEKRAGYWITRLFSAWKQFAEYANRAEQRLFDRCLMDIMTIDPAHRRYADPLAGYETPMQARASLGV